MDEVLKTLCIT